MTLVLFFVVILMLICFLALILVHFNLVYLSLGLVLLVLLFTFILAYSYLFEFYYVVFKKNAPYIRTGKSFIKRIIKEFDFQPQDKVYELGCGDARFLRELVKKKKCRAIGIEYSLVPYLIANILNLFSRQKIKLIYKNLFKADLSDADYIFVYLLPEQMERFEQKFHDKLKLGVTIISNTFKFKDWQPEKEFLADEDSEKALSNKVFVYVKKEEEPSSSMDSRSL